MAEKKAFSDVLSNRQPEKRQSAWLVLKNRDYSLLFWGQFISLLGTQIQVVVVAWQVYLLTHSAVALGLIGLLQAIPRILFSLVGGVSADAFDRRKLLLYVQTLLAACSAALALSTSFHFVNVFVIDAIILLAASVSAFDFPTRQAVIPTLVSREQMADALSLNMLMGQLTGVIGPTLGGFAITWLGIANSYWLDVFSYVVVIGSLLLMNIPRVPLDRRTQAGMHAILEGLSFLRTHPIILSVITLDFFAVLFGSPFALLPIYAGSILHAGSQGLGILLAADNIGAVALTPLAGRIGRIKRQGLGVALSIIAWGICIILFGLFPASLWLAALFLVGAGAANMASMILRFLVVQFITPDEFRGRISAINALFAFSGSQLGQLESGLVASLTSLQFSIVSGGVICILATIAIVACIPRLLRVQVQDATT